MSDSELNSDATNVTRRKYLYLMFLLSVFLSLRLYGIGEPLVEMHNVRQTQTAMITRNLLNDNFNVL